MSTPSESGSGKIELDLDLQLLPAWAQRPPEENRYARYEGRDADPSSRRPSRFQRGERRPGRGDFRKDRPERPGERKFEKRPPRPGGPPRPDERKERFARRVEVSINIIPEEKGVESLAKQIHLTGRAYPLFGVAALVLKRPDRYQARFNVVKDSEGKVVQPLFVCGLDETLWLSERDAVDHVLTKHFATFYQAERVATDPPKGTYTFVAQCGMSGTILGPPNYHDYQNKLRRLHGERFAHVPFDTFKSRIKIVRDEAVVKKWIEEQSWKTEYVCLNVPEATKLANLDDVEKHFRELHLPIVIKPVEAHTLPGHAALGLPDRSLQSAVRRALDEQIRFPLKVVNVLSQQFATHGLQFFKVNKTVTHVAVARPHYLDLEATPVSDGIKRIVELINATPNCTRRKLLESLAPSAPMTSGEKKEGAAQTETAPPSPEAAGVVSDLHWLIHQGHVIEFSSGVLETAKKPLPRPPRPEPANAPLPAGEAPATPAPHAHEDTGPATSPPTAELPKEAVANPDPTTTPDPRPGAGAPVADDAPSGSSSDLGLATTASDESAAPASRVAGSPD
ncbi:MAG: hypothetical protein FJ398_12760 [Verrucomicrobia bacterium]|nr:hypothetical protein [Verrucomicrobiota bacterium]